MGHLLRVCHKSFFCGDFLQVHFMRKRTVAQHLVRFLEWEQTQSTFSLNPLDQVVRALGMKKLERRSAVVMQKDFVKNIRHSSLVAIEQVKVHKKASSAFLPSKSKLAPHLAVVKQAGKQAHTLVQWAGIPRRTCIEILYRISI